MMMRHTGKKFSDFCHMFLQNKKLSEAKAAKEGEQLKVKSTGMW